MLRSPCAGPGAGKQQGSEHTRMWTKQGEAPGLVVVTLNVFPGSPLPFVKGLAGSRRLSHMIRQLRQLDPDVVCLQELFCTLSRDQICSAMPEYAMYSPPHAKTQASRAIKAGTAVLWTAPVALCAYNIVSGSTAWRIFVGASCALAALWLCWRSAIIQWIACGSSGLAVMWHRERLRARNTQQDRFGHQLGDAMNCIIPRGYQRIELESTHAPGFGCTVLNTHLNALGNDQHRDTQVLELLEAASGRGADTCATIVCGDMNARPHAGSISRIRAAGYADCGVLAGHTWDESKNSLCAGAMRVPAGRFDYIFSRCHASNREHTRPGRARPAGVQGIRLLDCRVVLDNPSVSDHFGVCAVFQTG